jgi:putative membrane protein insertion efficiency factor
MRTSGRSLGAWVSLALVQFYRIFLSHFFGGACKFYPSCSKYAEDAIALHGARRGIVLALKRLGRKADSIRCQIPTTAGLPELVEIASKPTFPLQIPLTP